EEAVTFNDDTICFDSSEGLTYSLSDLIVFYNHPMNIRSTCIPEATGVLAYLVVGFATRTNDWLIANQIANTTARRIATTGTIVSARQLDRFPVRQSAQELAYQGCLTNIGREAADCNYRWSLVHCFVPLRCVSSSARKYTPICAVKIRRIPKPSTS